MSVLNKVAIAMQRGIDRALKMIGEKGVEIFREAVEEQDLVVTGRLRDSFSYATDKDAKEGGPAAEDEDFVNQPKTPFTLSVGTNCIYAQIVDQGSSQYLAGQFGNPSTYDALFTAIQQWVMIKNIRPRNIEISQEDLAKLITDKIWNFGQEPHPFYEVAKIRVRAIVPAMIKTAISAELRKVKSVESTHPLKL